MASIKFDIRGDNSNFLRSLQGAQSGVQRSVSAIERAGSGMAGTFDRAKDSMLGGFKQIAMGLAGISALVEGGGFLKGMIDQMGEFTKAMKEVSTLSKDVTQNFDAWKAKVVDLTTQIPIDATQAAKAMYQIESAGHHGADAMKVLEESAKGAIGGVTDTATTADAITTILNSYNMSASEAARVNDLLFTTVRLGKTTMGELGQTISQVAPIAATYGIAIEDVLAAVATLTKSGTPTAMAIREVRDAITATTKSLGDSAFEGKTFLDAMDEVAKKSAGSNMALKEDLSTLKALQGVLGLTGKNAQVARQDFAEMKNSAGAAEEAYEKMADTAGASTQLLKNNIFKAFEDVGDGMIGIGKAISDTLNAGFDAGIIQPFITALEMFAVTWGVYRAALLATSAAQSLNTSAMTAGYEAQVAELDRLMVAQEAKIELDLQEAVNKGTLTAEQAMLITSLREEVAARQQQIMAAAEAAVANAEEAEAALAHATANKAAADEMMIAAQERLAAARATGVQSEISAAQEEVNTAAMMQNTAAAELNSASHARSVAVNQAATASKAAETTATIMETQAETANAVSGGVLASVKMALKRAQDAWNASMFASPIFWIAAVIVGVTYAVYELVTAESAHDRAVRETNEALDEKEKKLEEHKNKIQELIRTIQSNTSSAYDQAEAYNELNELAPELTKNYSLQELRAMDAAKAQKELNEQLNEAEYEETKAEVERLTAAIADQDGRIQRAVEHAGQGAGAASKMILDQIEAEKGQLEVLQQKLDAMNAARERAAEEAKPIEIRVQEAEENAQAWENIFYRYDEAMAKAQELQTNHDNLNFDEAIENLDGYIAEVQDTMADLQKQLDDDPTNPRLQLEVSEGQKVLNALLTMRSQWISSGATSIPLFFTLMYDSAKGFNANAQTKAEELRGAANGHGTQTDNLKKTRDQAKKNWDEAKKKVAEINRHPEKYTQEDLNVWTQREKTAKSEYEAAGGVTKTTRGHGGGGGGKKKHGRSGSSSRSSAVRNQSRYEDTERKQKLEQKRRAEDTQHEITQAEIDAMEEGTEKTLRQLSLDHDKKVMEIERDYEDLQRKKIDEAKALWEANPKTKDKKFDESSVDSALTADEQKAKQLQLDAAKIEYTRAVEAQSEADRQALADYLKEYGSYEEKKLALTLEYAEKIRKANAAGNMVEVAKLTAEQRKAMGSAKSEDLERQISYTTVFSEFGIILRDEMTNTLNAMREYAQTDDFKSKSFTDQQAFFNTINEIQSKFGTSSWKDLDFAKLGKQIDDYQSSLTARDQAEERAAQTAQKMIDAEQAWIKVQEEGTDKEKEAAKAAYDLAVANHTAAQTDLNNANAKVSSTQSQVAESAGKLKGQLDSVNNMLNAMTSGSLANIWTALTDLDQKLLGGAITKKIGDTVAKMLGKAFEGKSDLISLIIGAILNLLDILKEQGVGGIVGGLIEAILEAVGGILKNILSGKFLAQIGSALLNGVRSIFDAITFGGFSSWFTASGNSKQVNKLVERLERSNEALTYAIDGLKDEISKSGGDKATEYFERAYEAQKQQTENDQTMLAAKMGYHAAHHSNDYYLNEDLTAQDYQRINEALYRKFGKQYSVRSASDLWKLTSEELAEVSTLSDIWEKILNGGKYDQTDYLNNYIDDYKELLELQDAWRQSITDTSFDNVKSSMNSLLSDYETKAKDVIESVESMFRKAIIRSIVAGQYGQQLEDWYKKFAEYMKGGLSKAEADELKAEYQGYYNEMQKLKEDAFKAAGISEESEYSQEASSKGFGAMSQDTAEQLNGRFTALQIAGENISSQIVFVVQYMASMVTMTTERNQTLAEIRSMMFISNGFLEDIAKYTKVASLFGEKIDKIVEQTKNI